MSALHTQGRLTVPEPLDDQWAIVGAPPAGWQAKKYAVAVGIRNPEDARRLVACWNACEGISTERLEDLGRPLLAHLIGCDERAARQVKECDELLVPVVPTVEMNRAAFDAYQATGHVGEILRAMLAAAPQPPKQPDAARLTAAPKITIIAKSEGREYYRGEFKLWDGDTVTIEATPVFGDSAMRRQRDTAIRHLSAILASDCTATEAWQAKQAAAQWLREIGHEA